MADRWASEAASRYESQQKDVARQQAQAMQRQQAADMQKRQQQQEEPGAFGKVGSLIGGWLDNMWTDDFSAVPVVGPAASVLAGTYDAASRGISTGLSAGALAANPKYWENRGPDGNLLLDASRVQPGRAAVAGIQLLDDALTPWDAPQGPLAAPNIYRENPDFNIADDAQRDSTFDSNWQYKVASGVIDGLASWYLDPLVIGSKGVKIARFGTTAMGLGKEGSMLGRFTTGLTNRTILDQSGRVNQNVLNAFEREADEALAFAEGRGGREQPIGVIADTVAKGGFDDLLDLPQFQGQARDLLAAAGSAVTTKEDAIVFLAASAGSRKYQAMLADRATGLYAGLQRAARDLYTEKILNTPAGTAQPAILPDFLEKDFSVQKLVDDLAKRDPELEAALKEDINQYGGLKRAADLVSGDDGAGLIERIGGTNVTGMKIAQAWREGRSARSYLGERVKNVDFAPRASEGTGPAIFERVFYGASSLIPQVRVWDWVRGSHASGYIDIRGFNIGKASDELKAALSDSRIIRRDKAFVAAQLKIYGDAKTTAERMRAINDIEKNVARKLADEATKRARKSDPNAAEISEKRLEEIYSIIDKRRAEVVENFKGRAYGVDPEGNPIKAGALLRSQLETSMPMLNLRMLEKSMKIATRPHLNEFGLSTDEINSLTSQSWKNAIDEIQSLWKAGVLLRLGYTIRNTGEGWLRTAAFLGTVPALEKAPQGFINSFYNNSRRIRSMSLGKPGSKVRGRLPLTGLRGTVKREDDAVTKINDLSRDIAKLRATREERLAGDPTLGVTDLDAEIATKENALGDLTRSLERLVEKKADLKSRRAIGDDGAFGGQLNAEYADLYRRLAGAEQTTRNFLESAWARGQEDLLSSTAWGVIKPEKPQYWNELAGAVRQFRADEVTNRLLRGDSIGDVVAWLRSADARTYRREMKISKEAAEQRVVELSDMIAKYLPTGEARALAAKGQPDAAQLKALLGGLDNAAKPPKKPVRDDYQSDKSFNRAMAKYDQKVADYDAGLTATPQLSPIHGRQIAAVLGNRAESAYVRARQATIDRMFNLLGTYPESTLVRHPFYAEVWQRRFNQLEDIARAQGETVTPELLRKFNQAAHRYASRATNETLYTIERYSNIASAMRWFAPFFAAWENSAKVWTRMVVNDPSILARASILWQIPEKLGMVVDQEGNKVDIGPLDFLSGSQDRYIVLPDVVNDAVAKIAGGANVKIPLASLNVVTPGNTPYLPGFGPTVTILAGKILGSKPDSQKFLRDLLGQDIYEQIAPFGVPQTSVFDAFAPTAARKAYEMWQGEDSDAYLRVVGAMWQNAMTEWYLSGGNPADKPDADTVMQRANDFYKFSILSSLTLPVAVTRTSPYQLQIDTWNAMKADPSMTYAEKVDSFVRQFGEDFLPLITSTSKTDVPGVDPTIEDYNILRDHADLARSLSSLDPQALGILASSAPVGQFDEGVYKWLNENNVDGADGVLRGPRGVDEMGEAITMQAAWREFRQSKAVLEQEMQRRGLKSLESKEAAGLKAAWDDYVNRQMVEQYGEQWIANYRTYEEKTSAFLTGIQTVLGNRDFMAKNGDTPLWQQISEYMQSRQIALDAIKAGGDGKAIRDAFKAWAEDFKYSSLEFSDFYDRFLDNDKVNEIGLSNLGV